MLFRPITAILGVSLAVTSCRGASGESAKAAAPTPTMVRLASVSQEVVARAVSATGTLGPKEVIALSFKIGGVVSRVQVDAGATVRAGDILAALDLSEIDATVTRAQRTAEKADRDQARARRLYGDSVFTLAQLQDATTGADVAGADLATALFNRRYAAIVAPASGVILERRAEPGELVSAGTTVLVLGSRARGSVVRVGLADRDVVRIRRGDRAVVRFDALTEREFDGRVTEIAAAAEPGTGTYAVEIALPGAGELASGLVGQVEILPAGERSTLIPVEALLEADGASATVYALSPDRVSVERRRVTIAFITGDRVAITRGLEGVTSVITDGAGYLRDGEAVQEAP